MKCCISLILRLFSGICETEVPLVLPINFFPQRGDKMWYNYFLIQLREQWSSDCEFTACIDLEKLLALAFIR